MAPTPALEHGAAAVGAGGDGPCPRSLQPAPVGALASSRGQFDLFLMYIQVWRKGLPSIRAKAEAGQAIHGENITKRSSRMSCRFAFWQPKLSKVKEPFPLMQDHLHAKTPSLLCPMSYFFHPLAPFTASHIELASRTGQL